jgi:2-polyprenyl-3-methyl-5-hydroxy-6-metoxy-1,4-benzoquinol methylase
MEIVQFAVSKIINEMDSVRQEWANLPEPFGFYRLVLNSDHLHFGLWPDELPDLDLEKAQDRMFELLLSLLPKPPADILNVGCGLGLSASMLAQKGYRVTAIAPSPELISYAKKKYEKYGVDFQVAGFFENSSERFHARQYDIILFQESFQYLHPLNTAVHRARALLREKGKVIISDEMCKDRSIQSQTAVHHHQDVTFALAEHGFRILSRLEIQDQVKHTCSQIIEKFSSQFDDICKMINTDSTPERLSFFLEGWKAQQSWYALGKMGYEIIICRKDDVFIREYQNNDENMILPMFQQIFCNPRTMDHWQWKYRDNPYGRYHIIEAFSEQGELAGHFSGYPVMFYASDTQSDIRSIQGGDTMTSPAFRFSGRGPTSVLSRIANYFYDKFCKGAIPFIYGYNTGTIRKFGERFLQYEYLPQVPYHVCDAATAVQNFWGRFIHRVNGLSIRQIQFADPEFDRFFQTNSRHYGILVKRDAQYVQWRYLNCPDHIHRVYILSRWGKMIGWGVFSVQGNDLVWGDALCSPKYAQDMYFLLSQVLKIIQKETPISRIIAWFSPVPEWWFSELKEMGFSIIDEPNRISPCFKFFTHEFSIDYFARCLYYSMGDSDLF